MDRTEPLGLDRLTSHPHHYANVLVKTKILKAVNTDNHEGQSLYHMFSCILIIVLQSIWDQVINDASSHDKLSKLSKLIRDCVRGIEEIVQS